MLRLRDEARMTLHAYMVSSVLIIISLNTHLLQTLYESSTALGFRKSTQIETGKEIKMEKMETLIRENRELKQEGGKKAIVSLATIFPSDRKPESEDPDDGEKLSGKEEIGGQTKKRRTKLL